MDRDKDSELSEEFLSQLTPNQRSFIVAWERLQKNPEFQKKLDYIKKKILEESLDEKRN